MIIGFAVARLNEGHLIDVLGDIRVLLAHGLTALAILFKTERGLHQRTGVAEKRLDVGSQSTARPLHNDLEAGWQSCRRRF
jgi:hypothetical protein